MSAHRGVQEVFVGGGSTRIMACTAAPQNPYKCVMVDQRETTMPLQGSKKKKKNFSSLSWRSKGVLNGITADLSNASSSSEQLSH